VTAFVTNLRGPADQMSFLGKPIVDIVAVSETLGNVSIAFAVLSYAGALSVVVVADPDVCPDMTLVATELQRELDVMTGVEDTRWYSSGFAMRLNAHSARISHATRSAHRRACVYVALAWPEPGPHA
jgi:hypothetical protein